MLKIIITIALWEFAKLVFNYLYDIYRFNSTDNSDY